LNLAQVDYWQDWQGQDISHSRLALKDQQVVAHMQVAGYAQQNHLGAHRILPNVMTGRYFEDLQVGAVFSHTTGRTVTEMDNTLFSALTLNPQPLHINADFAARTEYGQRIVNGLFTLGLVVGLSVSDLTEGTIVANLGYDRVTHPNPLFHGDTVYAETTVLDKRVSASRPNCGVVRLKQVGRKQDGMVVVEFERTVLFLKRDRP
jgi:acyl dehydratase